MPLRAFLASLMLLLLAALPLRGQEAVQRYAVVVGNGAYQHAPHLPNARADAALVADFLRRAGFRVVERHDLDARGFEALLRQALFEIEENSEVLFYYAGHGFQIGRRNYLVPVDADLGTPADIAFETVTLDSLVAILGARSRLQVVILDSCRDNPFRQARMYAGPSREAQLTETGFSPMSAPVNTLLAFSTAPGAVALDGDGANSPFTGTLVAIAGADPQASITRILSEVRREVYRLTEGRQIPWESSTLLEDFAFGRHVAAPGRPGPAPAAPPARSRRLQPILAARADDGADGALHLTARLDRRVALGRSLARAIGPQDAPVSLRMLEADGRLTILGQDGAIRDHDGAPLPPATLDRLFFEPTHREEPARARPPDHARRATFLLRSGSGAERRVELTLTPDPCDWHAGDHLDPEGVGITRYPDQIMPEAARAACAAAVAAEPENGRFHYQLGRALIALTDYDAARAALERARDLGYTRAWHALGTLVALRAAITGGRGDGRADEAAYPFWYEGVRRGDPYAFHTLGKQLLRFGATEELRAIGFDLLSRAVEVGHSFAMNELGAWFLQEGTDHYDPRRGLQYLEESAARQDIYGYHNLGLVHDFGRGGVAPDAGRAAEWYRRAALGGHPTAPRRLADLILSGRLGDPDPAAAIGWYDMALMRGDARAGAEAAWLIAQGGVPGHDLADAALRAARAATLNDSAAARDAMDLLSQMPPRPLDLAAQRLMGELGETVTADGVFGPESRAALARIAAARDSAPPEDARGRLMFLARVAWERSPFRVDLY